MDLHFDGEHVGAHPLRKHHERVSFGCIGTMHDQLHGWIVVHGTDVRLRVPRQRRTHLTDMPP